MGGRTYGRQESGAVSQPYKSVRRNAANVSCFNGRSDPVLTKIDSVEEQMIDAGGAENEKIFRRD